MDARPARPGAGDRTLGAGAPVADRGQFHTEINLTRNLIENAKAEALADAGVYRAVLGLMDPNEAPRWKADGRVYTFRLGEGEDRAALKPTQ